MKKVFIKIIVVSFLMIFEYGLGQGNLNSKKLNFIVLLGDDISASSLGCYGSENHSTSPNIDKLSKQSVMFTNMFVSEAICAPTRAELYTGLQPVKNGCFQNHQATKTGTKSVVHYLEDLGYRVGLTGKTHFRPQSVYPFEIIKGFPKRANARYISTEDWSGVESFVNRDSEEPFCLFICSIHAHAPWDSGDTSPWDINEIKLPPHFADTKETRLHFREHLAEVRLFDDQVGKTLKFMKKNKLDENTVFIVLDENGTGMVGGKWTNYDWGVRSACLMKWPKKYKANFKTDAITQYCDILPTMIEAAGGNIPKNLDGKSLLSLIQRKESKNRDYAFFIYNNRPDGPAYPIRSVTDGKYKLIWNLLPNSLFAMRVINGFDFGHTDNMIDRAGRFIYLSWLENAKSDIHSKNMVKRFRSRPEIELYNLDDDPWEMNNIAMEGNNNEIVESLHLVLKNWMKEQGDSGIAIDK